MNLKIFRINRRILAVGKILFPVFCFSVIFYFDVPIYLLYKKIFPLKENLNGIKVLSELKPRVTAKFHRIHHKQIDDEYSYRTFRSLEEERLQLQEYRRILAEQTRKKRLEELTKKWFKKEYEGVYSDDDEFDNDDNDDDDADDDDDYRATDEQYKINDEEIVVDSRIIEYQLKGEKIPSALFSPGLLKLSRLYSLFYYLEGEEDPVGWPRYVSRKTIDYINRYDDTSFAHFPKDICVVRKPLVVIIVCSRPRNIFLRQSIRLTWARSADQYNFTVLFLMGYPPDPRMDRKLLEESNLRRDIILEQFDDVYNNLTLKSIFMLKWVQMYCAKVPFVLKVDDDAYLNLENLYKYVIQVGKNDTSKLLVGKVEPNAKPYRDVTHKWYMPYYLYKQEVFPNYTHGVAYLMSKQVASSLYEYTLKTEFIHLEDVFLTGICAQKLNITPVDQEEFRFKPNADINCGDKLFPKLAIVAHHVKVLDMYRIHYRALNCSIISLY